MAKDIVARLYHTSERNLCIDLDLTAVPSVEHSFPKELAHSSMFISIGYTWFNISHDILLP